MKYASLVILFAIFAGCQRADQDSDNSNQGAAQEITQRQANQTCQKNIIHLTYDLALAVEMIWPSLLLRVNKILE